MCRTSTKKQLRNAYYKITPNLLLEYQCTSGKFIRLPNRIEKIDSVGKIESNRNFFARIGMLYKKLLTHSSYSTLVGKGKRKREGINFVQL